MARDLGTCVFKEGLEFFVTLSHRQVKTLENTRLHDPVVDKDRTVNANTTHGGDP